MESVGQYTQEDFFVLLKATINTCVNELSKPWTINNKFTVFCLPKQITVVPLCKYL